MSTAAAAIPPGEERRRALSFRTHGLGRGHFEREPQFPKRPSEIGDRGAAGDEAHRRGRNGLGQRVFHGSPSGKRTHPGQATPDSNNEKQHFALS